MNKPKAERFSDADSMEDVSPERVVWRQLDRFLESLWKGHPEGIHGAISGLSICMAPFKGDGFSKSMESIRDSTPGFEERAIAQAEEIIRLLDSRGKWLGKGREMAEEGTEFGFGFS